MTDEMTHCEGCLSIEDTRCPGLPAPEMSDRERESAMVTARHLHNALEEIARLEAERQAERERIAEAMMELYKPALREDVEYALRERIRNGDFARAETKEGIDAKPDA